MAEGESATYSNIIRLIQNLNKLLNLQPTNIPTNQTPDARRLPLIIPLAQLGYKSRVKNCNRVIHTVMDRTRFDLTTVDEPWPVNRVTRLGRLV